MFIIQNSIFLTINFAPGNYIANIYNDKLKNKTINKIMVYSGDQDRILLNLFTGYPLTALQEADIASLYLTLTDDKDVCFVDNYNLLNAVINVMPNQFLGYNRFIELLINRKLNLEKSKITYKSLSNPISTIELLVFYQTRALKPFSDEVNGSVTVKLSPKQAIDDIPLTSLMTHTLRGKKIKKIYVDSGDDAPYYTSYANGYLDLVCADGKHIENLPLDFLRTHSPKDFYFDQLEIDFEKSMYKNRNIGIDRPVNLTFIY